MDRGRKEPDQINQREVKIMAIVFQNVCQEEEEEGGGREGGWVGGWFKNLKWDR